VSISDAAREVLARHPLLVLTSQAATPDCLVHERNTGQSPTGGGRAVLTAMLAKARKKIVGLHTKRKLRWIKKENSGSTHKEKTKMDRCGDGDQF
jgi:hypothetical protein